jgi:signal peptidase II
MENKLNWKKLLSNYSMLVIVAGALVILDQVTKEWIRNTLAYGEIYRPDLWLSQYARIMHWSNTGAAWGMFQGYGFIFTGLSFVVGLIIIYYYPQVPREEWPVRLALSIMLAGSMGNLIDRLRLGHVTDFISIGTVPVFNVADSCISVGTALLLLSVWILEKRQEKEPANEPVSSTATETTPELPNSKDLPGGQ